MEGDTVPMSGEYWFSRDGSRLRSVTNLKFAVRDDVVRTTTFRTYVSEVQLLINESKLTGRENEIRFSALKPPPESSLMVGPMDALLGYDFSAGHYWFQVFGQPNSKAQLRSNRTEGTLLALVSTDSFGDYEFEFTGNVGRLVLTRVKIERSVGDCALREDGEKHVLGSGRFEQRIGESFELTGLKYRNTEPIELASYTVRRSAKPKDKESPQFVSVVRTIVHSSAPLKTDLPTKIEFPDFRIPNGTRVQVRSDRKVPYQIVDGCIVKMTDIDGID